MIDETSISTDQDRRFVLLVNKEGLVEHRTITLGSRHGTQRVVRAGLRAGDRVIVDGGQRVKPGETVKCELQNGSDSAKVAGT